MVKNSSKGRGRPRSYEESEALDRAVRVFWAKGFDGATIDDLVEATGVRRPSLYATFGDKETLFMRCLDRYSERFTERGLDSFLQAPTAFEAVQAFLRWSVENATGEDTPSGCMMGCVAPVVDDLRIRNYIAATIAGAAKMIEDRLRAAITEGELALDYPAARRSRQIVDCSMALALRARTGTARADLLQDAEDNARLLVA